MILSGPFLFGCAVDWMIIDLAKTKIQICVAIIFFYLSSFPCHIILLILSIQNLRKRKKWKQTNKSRNVRRKQNRQTLSTLIKICRCNRKKLHKLWRLEMKEARIDIETVFTIRPTNFVWKCNNNNSNRSDWHVEHFKTVKNSAEILAFRVCMQVLGKTLASRCRKMELNNRSWKQSHNVASKSYTVQ